MQECCLIVFLKKVLLIDRVQMPSVQPFENIFVRKHYTIASITQKTLIYFQTFTKNDYNCLKVFLQF